MFGYKSEEFFALELVMHIFRRIKMKEFNVGKFREDLIVLRDREIQDNFAQRLGVKRPTLSLLENGKQLPSIDLLSRVCIMNDHSTEDYFIESRTDALVYLMGSLEDSDREKIKEMAERIRIKEKYEAYAKRG